jgi:hypothetical protein
MAEAGLANLYETRWKIGPNGVLLGMETLSPDRLSALRMVATIESVGSSTHIEGAKLADVEVEDLLSRAISIKFFKTCVR